MPPSNPFPRRALPWTDRRVTVRGVALRVLVVDDNQNGALALAAYLSLEGVECRTAFGGYASILTGTEWMPHVILMDISMPECNGFEAARTLRHDSRTSAIAIVAHTALDETEVRRQVKGDEFDGYLQKGGSLIQLIQLLSSFTGDASG